MTERIRRAIRERGPITFAEFMELSLYGAGGFYERPPVGTDGDFVTAPHVHPVFAELVARAVLDLHGLLGEPRPFRLSEVGAGDGTLARGLLDQLAVLDVRYTAVERSPGARAELEAIEGVSVVAERLEGTSDLILANELLDNLPFRRFLGTADGPKEVLVGLEGERLVERLGDPSSPPPVTPAEGEESIVPEGALAFLDDVAARLAHPGFALLIDYGGVGGPGGPVHGYRAHRPVGELLDTPGSADITAGVDFALVAEHAQRRGLVAFPTVTQRHALTSLGFDRWIHAELGRQAALLDAREGVEAVRAWSGRSRATLLVDPTALGRLRWLLLATPGVSPPSWL
jgi:NADH dehydrogenase [ubiquinone] 1 alpha subcomplex assembly factor 7